MKSIIEREPWKFSSLKISSYLAIAIYTLQMKYDVHDKFPMESYQIQFGIIPVAIWYEYHTSVL